MARRDAVTRLGSAAPSLAGASGVESAQSVAEEVARRWARLRARLGGRRVALVATADRDGVLGLLAALRGGRPPVLVHPRSAPREREALAARFDAVEVEARELGETVEASSTPPGPSSLSEREPEAIAVVIPTSGTTGAPKGVRLSFRALVAAADASAAHLGWRPADRWLLTIPVAHVGGLSIVTRCLLAGAAVALPNELSRGFRPDAFRRDVEATGATLVSLVPTMLRRLLTDPGFAWPSTIRAALIGGAAAPPELLARAHDRGWPVLATYGLTEAAAQVATQRPGEPPAPSGAVGPPLPGVEVRIQAGRIQIRGATTCSGYEPDGDPVDPGAWFDTGDHGDWDDDGRLRVRGRGSDLIVSGGENVFPAEVEAVLRQHPDVEDACVVGVPDAEWGEAVAAALVGRAASPPDLSSFVEERLAGFRRPRLIRWAPTLPNLPSGKPDRAAVRAWLGSEVGED